MEEEKNIERVIFFAEDGKPLAVEFTGAEARFFRQLKKDFAEVENERDVLAVTYGVTFTEDCRNKERQSGVLYGEPENIVKQIVSGIMAYAQHVKNRSPKLVVADIADLALRNLDNKSVKRSEKGLLLPNKDFY